MFEQGFKDNNDIAILFCDPNSVLDHLTYNQVFNFSVLLQDSLKIIPDNAFVGILIEHNIYLPSVLLCFERKKCPFMFLNYFDDFKACNKVCPINYIITLKDNKYLKEKNRDKVINIKFDDTHRTKLLIRKYSETIHENDGIFCVMKTSGSTGQSKFVEVTRNGILDNSMSLSKNFNLTKKDVIYWGTPLTFDPSLIEFLLAIENKCPLIITSKQVRLNQNQLYRTLFQLRTEIYQGITFLQIVPSVFNRWSDQQIKEILICENLKYLAFGGEMFPNNILLYDRKNDLRVFNLYGVTELSCWATIYEIQNESFFDPIHIGSPIGDTKYFIMEYDFDGSTNKSTGEIVLESKTRHCKILNESPQGSQYYTGDLVKISKFCTSIVCRKDNVIKRFGKKLPLTYFERIIHEKLNLKNKFIWYSDKLSLYLEIKNIDVKNKSKIIDKITIQLGKILNDDVFPDYVDIIENFPLNKHGKVSTMCLQNFYVFDNPRHTKGEDFLFSMVAKYVGVDLKQLSNLEHYTLYELGVNSILIIQLLEEFKLHIKKSSINELTNIIFERRLYDILDYLKNYKFEGREVKNEPTNNSNLVINKVKSNFKFKQKWKYNLRQCVDSTAMIFQKGGQPYIAIGCFSNIFAVLTKDGEEICKMTLPGIIISTPCISACKKYFYVGCFNRIMYCIDYLNKSILWSYTTKDRIKCAAILCRNNNAIIFGSYDGYVYCLDSLNGNLIWKTNVGERMSNNLLRNGGKLYFPTLCKLVCMCENNGYVIWEHKSKGFIHSDPCLTNDDKDICFADLNGNIFKLYTSNGLVSNSYATNAGQVHTSLVNYKDFLIYGCYDDSLYVLQTDTFELVHKIFLGGVIYSNPCSFYDDKFIICCTNGSIFLVDVLKACVLTEISLPGDIFSSPILFNNTFYVGCRDNHLHSIEITE